MSIYHASTTNTASLTSSTRPQLKRKRSAIEVDKLYEDAYTTSLRSRDGVLPRKYNPICLLPRSQLPLAWLDPSDNGIQHLTGELPMLDVKTRTEAVVVVAEDLASKRIFAIERAGSKVYALCRLSAAVEQRAVRSRAIIRYNIVHIEQKQAIVQPARKRQNLLTPPPQSSSPVEVKPSQLVLPDATMDRVMSAPFEDNSQPFATVGLLKAAVEEPSAIVNIDEMLQELTKQYLDALYLSRTSIAYFAKGPLARVRHAAVAIAPDLIAYLREMLLSTSITDKRQRETLPELVKDSAEPIDESQQKKPRKTKWRAKRDKTGLLHDEKHYVQQWWQNDQDDVTVRADETIALHVNQRLQTLRKRETFLQVALLLETMIKEGAEGKEKSKAVIEESVKPDKKKSKKDIDLQALLESLLDRLTIWHSVDFKSPEKKTKIDDSTPSETNDELRSFCTEVIIPFYMSKLPKTASFVNKKLGGPSTHTPSKRKTSSRKPGEPTKRPSSDKQHRRPLNRTITDSSLPTQRATPGLERSDSMQSNTRIKREHSVSLSLSQIPAIRPGQLSQALASLSRREIDLTAVSTANESRLRRKAEQEAKVREAVASIRRPDRTLALKENAALVDANFAKNIAKKGQSSVHIAATPVLARYIAATPQKQGQVLGIPGYTTAYLAPPQLQAIPQTGHRDRMVDHSTLTPAIDEAEDSTGYAFPADLNETPIIQRTKLIDATPSRPRVPTLLATPITKPSTFQARLAPPLAELSTNMTITTPIAEKSVYDLFGWNNDDYEPLA